VVFHLCEKRFFSHAPINSREEKYDMIPQREASDSIDEQVSSPYGSYQGNQQDAGQHDAISYEQPLREEPAGKVYPLLNDNKNMLRLIWFVVAMVALLAFAVVCLVIVGGTAGWISFCAASFTIMVVASTAISTIK
jgi:hypothetical protein